MDTEYGRQGHGQGEVLVPGVLLGFRRWYIDMPSKEDVDAGKMKDVPILKGQMGHVWADPYQVAECKPPSYGDEAKHEEPVPHWPCTCGIYASYHPDSYDQSGTYTFAGVVEAQGRVLCGTKGFRAGAARLRALYIGAEPEHSMIYEAQEFADALKAAMDAVGLKAPTDEPMERYGWLRTEVIRSNEAYNDVELYDSWDKFIADFAQSDLSGLGIEVER